MGRQLIISIFIVAILLAGGAALYWYLFEKAPASVPVAALGAIKKATPEAHQSTDAPSPTIKANPNGINVVSVVGSVKRRKGNLWINVKSGDELKQDEAIRTGRDGQAVLDIGQQATVKIASRSHFSVREISKTVSRVRLEEGRISTVVHGKGSSKFKVEVKGSDAIAETSKGEFSILTDGKGQVAVSSNVGKVKLSSKNKTVEVTPGKLSIVRPNLPPAPPKPIPPSLFLKIGKPGKRFLRKKNTTIRGKATPGAIVSINGVRVKVNRKGRFRTVVALREGKNNLNIEALDVQGKQKIITLPTIIVDSKAPDVKSDVTW